MSSPWTKLGVTAASLWCLAGLGVLVSWGFFSGSGPPIVFGIVVAIAVLGGVARFLVGRRHQGKLVFWLRRFGDLETPSAELNRWHGRILSEAAQGIALPLTLQDESVDTPPLVASLIFLPVFLPLMIGSLGSMLWLFELPFFNGTLGSVLVFFIGVLGVTLPSVLAMLVTRRLGTRRVTPGDATAIARRGARGRRSHSGLLVLGCKSQHWQQCVRELLGSVDFAVIDETVLSENVEWEVEVAAEKLGPDRLLLLRALPEAAELVEQSQSDRWTSIRYDLSRAFDELAAFSRSWRREKHQLADPDASLGPVGLELAGAIREWMLAR